MKIVKSIASIALTIGGSLLLVLLGIVYFMLTMWMIKIGAHWAGYQDVSGDMVVITAGIITAATVIGSSLQKH